MGAYSYTEGFGFESQHHILDGSFSHIFVLKFLMFVWKDKNKRKRGRMAYLKRKFEREEKSLVKVCGNEFSLVRDSRENWDFDISKNVFSTTCRVRPSVRSSTNEQQSLPCSDDLFLYKHPSNVTTSQDYSFNIWPLKYLEKHIIVPK